MAEYDDGVSAAINRRRREESKVRDGGIVVRHAPLILISEREIIRRSYLFIHIHETFPKFIYKPSFFYRISQKIAMVLLKTASCKRKEIFWATLH
jgi:hypothetical protein